METSELDPKELNVADWAELDKNVMLCKTYWMMEFNFQHLKNLLCIINMTSPQTNIESSEIL